MPKVMYFHLFSYQGARETKLGLTASLGRKARSFRQVRNVSVVKTDVSFCITGWYLSALDSVFLAIYFMEIVLKLYALRSFFFKTGWNIMGKKVILLNYFGFWRRDHNLLLIKKITFFPHVVSERSGLGAAYHDLSDCTGWVFAKSANQPSEMTLTICSSVSRDLGIG